MSNRIYLSPPDMSDEDLLLLTEAFQSNWIAPLGPHVDAFEQEFTDLLGIDYAVALSSGTAALHLALLAIGVKPGDEVYTSSLTFIATTNSIRYCGAKPVFIDSERSSWNLDPELLEAELRKAAEMNRLPAAVVVVDVFGQCAQYDEIVALCRKYEVPVIEDAAESLGAEYHGRPAGTLADIGCFSFNGNKIITTSGGGMLVTENRQWADKVRHLATQARMPQAHYEHETVGYNYRLSNLLAAIGRGQLRSLQQRVARRRYNFLYYSNLLGDLAGVSFMPELEGTVATRWLTCMTIDSKLFGCSNEDVRLALEAGNIEARPVWKPMHLQPVNRDCRVVGGAVSEDLFYKGLCLPSGSGMRDNELEKVTTVVCRCFYSNTCKAAC